MNRNTTLDQSAKKYINGTPEVQLRIAWYALDQAINDLKDSHDVSLKQKRRLGSLIEVATPAHMVARFMTEASKTGSIWKHLTAHYNEYPLWLLVHDSAPTLTFSKMYPDPKAFVGFDGPHDPKALAIVKDYFFDGTLSAPGFRALPAELLKSFCLESLSSTKVLDNPRQNRIL